MTQSEKVQEVHTNRGCAAIGWSSFLRFFYTHVTWTTLIFVNLLESCLCMQAECIHIFFSFKSGVILKDHRVSLSHH